MINEVKRVSDPSSFMLDDSYSQLSTKRVQQLIKRRSYMLNDFDDEHSVSDAADVSMMSGSRRRISMGVPYVEATHLEPSSKLMAGMAPHIVGTAGKDLASRVGSAYGKIGEN